MNDRPKDDKTKPGADSREARLAKALRENLRRRKGRAGQGGAIVDSDKAAR